MRLEKQDFGLLQLGVDAIMQRLAQLGLTLTVERDFAKLGTFLVSRGGFANPTFDPSVSRIGDEDFWLAAVDGDGRIVASSAERVLETEDFLDLIATGRIWYEAGFVGHFDIERVPVLDLSTRLAGRISHSGSTFVEPVWRRCGLAMYLTYLSRALSFRNAECGVNTGFVRHSLFVTPVPTSSYGYAHVEKCLDGYFPPMRASERLYLCWIDAQEFVGKLLELPRHSRYPVTLPHQGGSAASLAAE